MTPNEARDAIAGERRVVVFFADEVLAVRMRLASSSGKRSLLPLLPSEPGETWELVGKHERLVRGYYDVPMFAERQQAFVVLELTRLANVNPPLGLGIQLGIVIERNGIRYLLHQSAGTHADPAPARAFPASATLEVASEPPSPSKKIFQQAEQILTAEATSAGVVAARAPAENREWVMKRAALKSKHVNQWPTIDRDLRDASENGLSKAAKAPGHGEWFEAAALDWARQRGKLDKSTTQAAPVNSVFNLAGQVHRIRG